MRDDSDACLHAKRSGGSTRGNLAPNTSKAPVVTACPQLSRHSVLLGARQNSSPAPITAPKSDYVLPLTDALMAQRLLSITYECQAVNRCWQ
ncbi:hypothetical protein [Burkholderia sp. BCC1998]|uniref:hypothetical protein n=1 Tax=Burkholderia sp. BCC1998 TaxID=2817447 RepID=UPI002AB625A7|nr:hypothetical protein [Burkholderia sp. BCC1998]